MGDWIYDGTIGYLFLNAGLILIVVRMWLDIKIEEKKILKG